MTSAMQVSLKSMALVTHSGATRCCFQWDQCHKRHRSTDANAWCKQTFILPDDYSFERTGKGPFTLRDSDSKSEKFLWCFAAYTLIFSNGSLIFFSPSLLLSVSGPQVICTTIYRDILPPFHTLTNAQENIVTVGMIICEKWTISTSPWYNFSWLFLSLEKYTL